MLQNNISLLQSVCLGYLHNLMLMTLLSSRNILSFFTSAVRLLFHHLDIKKSWKIKRFFLPFHMARIVVLLQFGRIEASDNILDSHLN